MGFFDSNILKNTVKTLNTRQDDPRNKWFFTRTPWIQFRSYGELTGVNNARNDYILNSGLKNKMWAPPSAESGNNRPAPGITELTITPKNAKGTVREATITWQCWTIEQFDIMEKLFMTPGLTCNVQWGWSQKIVKGKAPESVSPRGDGLPVNSKVAKRHEVGLIKSSAGHAGALQGLIVDFDWTINSLGGFDCSTTIMGQGDFMNQLAIDVNTEEVSIGISDRISIYK